MQKMKINPSPDAICPAAKPIDLSKLVNFHWISYDKSKPTEFTWKATSIKKDFELPKDSVLDYDDELSWRLGYEGDPEPQESESNEEDEEENEEEERGGRESSEEGSEGDEEDDTPAAQEQPEPSRKRKKRPAGPSTSRQAAAPKQRRPSSSTQHPTGTAENPAVFKGNERQFVHIRSLLYEIRKEQKQMEQRVEHLTEKVSDLIGGYHELRAEVHDWLRDRREKQQPAATPSTHQETAAASPQHMSTGHSSPQRTTAGASPQHVSTVHPSPQHDTEVPPSPHLDTAAAPSPQHATAAPLQPDTEAVPPPPQPETAAVSSPQLEATVARTHETEESTQPEATVTQAPTIEEIAPIARIPPRTTYKRAVKKRPVATSPGAPRPDPSR